MEGGHDDPEPELSFCDESNSIDFHKTIFRDCSCPSEENWTTNSLQTKQKRTASQMFTEMCTENW